MGANRVGVRISPHFMGHGILDNETEAMALYLAQAFSARGIAYLHIAESDWVGGPSLSQQFRHQLRTLFTGTLIYCGNYSATKANMLIEQGLGDAVAFGRPFIANPDLVARFTLGAELNKPDQTTFYGGQEQGYTDYPYLSN